MWNAVSQPVGKTHSSYSAREGIRPTEKCGRNGDEITEWISVHNHKLHSICSAPDTVTLIKQRINSR